MERRSIKRLALLGAGLVLASCTVLLGESGNEYVRGTGVGGGGASDATTGGAGASDATGGRDGAGGATSTTTAAGGGMGSAPGAGGATGGGAGATSTTTTSTTTAAGGATCPPGTLGALTDDFSDSNPMPFWNRYQDGAGTADETGGTVNITVRGGNGAGYISRDTLSLMHDCGASIKVANAGQSGVITFLFLKDPANANNQLAFIVSDGRLSMALKRQGQPEDLVVNPQPLYSGTDHRYWRISISGTMVSWDTSSTGTDWYSQGTRPTSQIGFDVNNLQVQFGSNSSDTTTPVQFDDFNLP